MIADRDTLLASLALRSGLIPPHRLAPACAEWRGTGLPLGDFLLARGLLGAADLDRLQRDLDALLAESPEAPRALLAQLKDDDAVRTVLESLPHSRFDATIDLPATAADRPRPAPPSSSFADLTTAHGLATSAPAPSAARRLAYEALDPISPSGEFNSLRYTRTKIHAQGGVGQIWLARDTTLGREVALKELKPEQTDNPIVRDRFIDEARITGQLEHPGIVPIYELSRHPDDHRPFYTMKFVNGRTLSRALRDHHERRGRGEATDLEFRALLDSFVAVCNAIAYAHSRGVVHRDLKGQNIMLGDFGEVLVLDWGLAKPVAVGATPPSVNGSPAGNSSPGRPAQPPPPADPAATLPADTRADGTRELEIGSSREATLEGQILGTPAYMPPEQADGRLDDIGPWSDVYSLGAVLYEILAGTWPFSGCNTTADLLRHVRQGKLSPPREINPSAPRALEAVCLKAMAHSPSRRYSDASALAADVRRWLADEPVSCYTDPWPARAARWARRHRTAVLASAAVVALGLPGLALANVLVARQRDRAEAMEGVARTAVDDFYVEVADTWLEDASDPRQEQYLDRALALYQGPLDRPDPLEEAPPPPLPAPELDPARRQSAEGALAYFERLAEESPRGSAARRDVAKTLVRIGDLRRKLGRPTEAETAYLNAISRLDPVAASDPAASRDRSRALARLGSLRAWLGRTEEAEADLDGAITLFNALPADDSRATALDLATAEIDLADLLKVTGRAPRSDALYEAAITRLEPLVKADPGDAEAARQLAVAADGLAVVRMLSRDPGQAEPLLRRAVDLLAPLRARFPTVSRYREALAKASNTLGLVLKAQGKTDDALKALAEAEAQYRRLADDFPGRVEYRRALARALANHATLLDDTGDLRAAEPLFTDAAAQYEQLARTAPEIPKIRRDLALTQNSLGTVLARRSKDAEAFTAYRRSIEVGRALAAKYPDVPDYRYVLGSALLNLGIHERIAGDLAASDLVLAESAQLYQELTKSHPDRPLYAEQLGRALDSLGLTLTALGRKDEAEGAFRRSIVVYESALTAAPTWAPAREGLAGVLLNLATNRPADTDALQQRALDLYTKLLAERPDSTPLKLSLAMGQYNRADRLKASGQAAEAEALIAQSAQGFDALIPPTEPGRPLADPAPAVYGAMAYTMLGQLRLDDRPAEAASALESAVARARQAVQATSGRAYLPILTDATDLLVRSLLAQSRFDDASRAALSLSTAAPSRPQLRVDAARLLARCVAPVNESTTLDPSSRSSRSRDLADRAIAQLRVAVDSGYRSADLNKLPDLSSLSGRDDFRAIASEAASPGE